MFIFANYVKKEQLWVMLVISTSSETENVQNRYQFCYLKIVVDFITSTENYYSMNKTSIRIIETEKSY